MARKKKRRRGGALGYNADARDAMQLARKGKCELAWRAVINASDATFYNEKKDIDDAHLARVIVNQHCGRLRTKPSGPKGKKQRFPYWGARKRKRS
jgi:hypothetical protein